MSKSLLGKAFQVAKKDDSARVVLKNNAPSTKQASVKLGKAFQPNDNSPFASANNFFGGLSGNTVKLPNKINLTKKEIAKFERPPVSEQLVEQYSPLERAVQNLETLNDLASGALFVNSLALSNPNAASLPKPFKSLNKIAGKIGAKNDYADVALWAVDASRALLDPEYRSEIDKGINRFMDSGLEGSDMVAQALQYGAQRPVGHAAGLMRSYQNTAKEQKRLDAENVVLDQKLKKKKEDSKSAIIPKGSKVDDQNVGKFKKEEEDALKAARDFFLKSNQQSIM
jgi:hypothetical protein